MEKFANVWEISNLPPHNGEILKEIIINEEIYIVDDSIACITHAILLLIEAINDKRG
jgi:hypothetical protein